MSRRPGRCGSASSWGSRSDGREALAGVRWLPALTYHPMVMSMNADVSSEAALKVLADPLRRRIVELLAAEQLCTCHLVEETGAGQTTVSNALRVLREAGMVETEPCGRFTYYRLRPQPLNSLSMTFAELARSAEAAQERRRPC